MKKKIYYFWYMLHLCGVRWIYEYIRLKVCGNEKCDDYTSIKIKYDYFVQNRMKQIIKYDKDKFAKELTLWYKCCARQYDENGDILNPRTFNEKLQYLKICGDMTLMTELSDKYEVRNYVEKKIGKEYLIPILDVWESPEEINFDNLPNEFILKTNHGSGENIIITDKNSMNMREVISKFRQWLEEPYGVFSMEVQYWNIKRKIIAEQYMRQSNRTSLVDYKIYCFDGKPKYIHLITNRDVNKGTYESAFYDEKWIKQPFDYAHNTLKIEPKPQNLEGLLKTASQLSTGFPFVRVDLYDIDGNIYFGEMTFTPGGGTMKWTPSDANRMLGDLIEL